MAILILMHSLLLKAHGDDFSIISLEGRNNTVASRSTIPWKNQNSKYYCFYVY